MLKFLRAAAALGAGLTLSLGAAQAAEPARIYFANGMSTPVQVEIDDHDVGTLEAQTVSFLPLAAGEHVIKVTMDDGSSISKPYTLDEPSLATAKGGRWWCLAVAPKGEGAVSGYLFQFPTDNCKAFVEAGS
jgi:hypothetical protein